MILTSSSALNIRPKRIVSLVPSQTELLYQLGLDEEVIGITKFCIHPDKWYRSKLRVGGTKTIDIEKVKTLTPDLILANKEENRKEQIEDLAEKFPVWLTDINNLDDAVKMITDIGELTGKAIEAQLLNKQIITNFDNLIATFKIIGNRFYQTAYLIWKDPIMTIGSDTFIHDMMQKAGFKNVFADKKRYPEITFNQLLQCNCELLLLSSEPYPFKHKDLDELQLLLPKTKILLVDGEMFSWYGSRLVHAPAYFNLLVNNIKS